MNFDKAATLPAYCLLLAVQEKTGLTEHLAELRRRLIICFVAVYYLITLKKVLVIR